MKKIILLLAVFGMLAVASGVLALEVSWPNSPLGTDIEEALQPEGGLPKLIQYFYEWLIFLGGLAAFISLVMAGFRYLTSAGDPTRMKGAMGQIKSAGLGLVLLLSAVLILNTINPQLTQLSMPPITLSPGEILGQCETDEYCRENWGEDYECNEDNFCVLKSMGLGACAGVILYTGKDGGGGESGTSRWAVPEYETDPGFQFTIKSIRFIEPETACQLQLFQLANFKANADYPLIAIFGGFEGIKNVADLGATEFRSARLINLAPSITQ